MICNGRKNVKDTSSKVDMRKRCQATLGKELCCEECGLVVKTCAGLLSHKRKHKLKTAKCHICDRFFRPRDMPWHNRGHDFQRTFTSYLIDQEFQEREWRHGQMLQAMSDPVSIIFQSGFKNKNYCVLEQSPLLSNFMS